MDPGRFICIILMTIFVLGNGQDMELNNKCSFTSGKNVFTCDGLQSVGPNLGPFLTKKTHLLIIKNSPNKIVLESDHHNSASYEHIVSYDLIENGDLELEPGAFVGMKSLHYMKISGNNLQKLNSDTFKGLKNIELLNLAKNNLKEMESGTFNDLSNLQTLDISQNHLTKIKSNLFKDLSSLTLLFLEKNRISTIENGAFSGLNDLELLDLTHNSLRVLKSDTFNSLNNLQTLELGVNDLAEIDGNLRLTKLTFIQLHHNKLRTLSANVFEHCHNIQSINLSHNLLSANLTQEPFKKLAKLRHLNLKDNHVDVDNFKELNNVVLLIHNN